MIGYLGPDGSFTHQALKSFLENPKNSGKTYGFPIFVPLLTISQVIDSVSAGKIQAGIVPFENSIEGSVNEAFDELIKSSQKVNINYEIVIPIEHCLITQGKNLAEIKKVFAHSQALSQCRTYLKNSLPEAVLEPVSSNSLAVQMTSESKDSSLAAIGPAAASEIYNVPILKKGINDEKENYTRFVLISTETMALTGKDKTTIAFSIPHDKAGSLVQVLSAFSNENINLLSITSRPSKKTLGEYVFFIDVEGHREDVVLKGVLDKIASETSFYRWFGSYQRS